MFRDNKHPSIVQKTILTIGSKFDCDKLRNIQSSITYSKSHSYSFNIRPITPNVWITVANFNSEETCQESVITKTVIQKVNRGYSIVQYQVDYGGYSTRQTVRHCLGWHNRSKMSKSTIKRRSRIETRAELPSRHRDYPFTFFSPLPSQLFDPVLLSDRGCFLFDGIRNRLRSVTRHKWILYSWAN